MRILVITNYFPPFEMGGWPQLTYDIVRSLKARGNELLVLTSRHMSDYINSEEPGIYRVLHLQSPDHEYYHPHYTLAYPLWQKRNRRQLRRAVISFSPDIIFIHGLWNLSKDIARYAEIMYPDKVVYFIANTWPTDQNIHAAYWFSPAARPWLQLPKRLVGSLMLNTIFSEVGNNKLRLSPVLCISRFIQQYLINEVGIPKNQTRVVYSGVDVDVYKPLLESQHDDGICRLLYAGGLWEHKGITIALDALGQVVRDFGCTNVNMTLLGSGHPQYKQSLKDKIQSLRIHDLVKFLDWVPRDHMPILLRDYDVLIFPSTGPEALPRIVMEAMASGLVSIGSRIGGTTEIIKDGVNGLSFDSGDVNMLAEKIVQVVDNKDIRFRLAQAGRRTIVNDFRFNRMVDELERYLPQLVDSL